MSNVTRREYLQGIGFTAVGATAGTELPSRGRPERDAAAWPSYQFDGRNSGYNPTTYGPIADFREVRTFDPPADTVSSPVLTSGSLYLGASAEADAEQGLYAYDREDGARRWHREIGGVESVAVADDTVVASSHPRLYGIDPSDGSTRWRADTAGAVNVGSVESIGSPIAVAGAAAVAVDDGRTLWESAGPDQEPTTPAAIAGDTVYYLGHPKPEMVAVDGADGAELWRQPGEKSYPTAAPTVAHGRVYTVVGNDNIEAYDASDGSHLWTSPKLPSTPVTTRTPAVTDGIVYQAADDLLAFDAEDGSLLWKADPDVTLIGTAAVSSETVYASSLDGSLVAVTRDGEIRGGTSVSRSTGTTTVHRGRVYVGAAGSGISEVGGTTDPSTPTSTPTTRRTRTSTPTGTETGNTVTPSGENRTILKRFWGLLVLLIALLVAALLGLAAYRRRSDDEEDASDRRRTD